MTTKSRMTIALALLLAALSLSGCGLKKKKNGPSNPVLKLETSYPGQLLDEASLVFLGGRTWREQPLTVDVASPNVMLGLRRRPYLESDDSIRDAIQCLAPAGEVLWEQIIGDRQLIDLLSQKDRIEYALLRSADTSGATRGAELWALYSENGSIMARVDIPWDTSFTPVCFYAVGTDSFLVHGVREGAENHPYETYGEVVNTSGDKLMPWHADAGPLYRFNADFIGITRLPGDTSADLALLRMDRSGNVLWRIALTDSLAQVRIGGIAPTPEGDLMISAFDWHASIPVIARVGGSDGRMLWVKRLLDFKGFVNTNLIAWTDGSYLAVASKPFSSAEISSGPWDSLIAFTFDGAGAILDVDTRTDAWMRPIAGVFQLAAGQAVIVGVGGKDRETTTMQPDIAWATLGLPVEPVSSATTAEKIETKPESKTKMKSDAEPGSEEKAPPVSESDGKTGTKSRSGSKSSAKPDSTKHKK